MLEEKSELKPAFVNPITGKRKSLECIRVDGAGDEGPLHEVQFLWTARHPTKGSIGTLVTTRSSGSSYLNKVELQNGCLALAHSNLFIPSTFGGSCISPAAGKVDKQKYTNMDTATDVYISRTNHCPCGETVNLYKGADSLEKQECKHLLQCLKGSKKQRESLKQGNPELYAYFDLVGQLRINHMVKNVPSNYFSSCLLS